MRLATTFLFASLASSLFPSVAGVAGIPHSPRTKDPRAIAQRQYHLPRALIDLCISLDARAFLGLAPVTDPLLADAHLCLCLNDLSIFLKSDIAVALAKLLGGESNLVALLKFLINISPDSRQCKFPDHSHSTCTAADPCGFTCDAPYILTPDETMCICVLPFRECNGQCGNFPNGCGSSAPQTPKRRAVQDITTLKDAQRSCKPRENVCGIPGREGTKAFECIDTSVALESCGGCVTPHPFHSPTVTTGVDCGRLPGVIAASCTDSQCFISRCRAGWLPAADRTACVEVSKQREDFKVLNRMTRKELRLVVDAELFAKIRNLVDHVVILARIAASVPVPPSSVLPIGSSPPIDHLTLVSAIVASMQNVLTSLTVVGLVGNINALVMVEGLAVNTLRACGCADGGLVASLGVVVQATVNVVQWCHEHPVAGPPTATTTTRHTSSITGSSRPSSVTNHQRPPKSTSLPRKSNSTHFPHPTSSSSSLIPTALPVPNTSDALITLGLKGVVDALLAVLVQAKVELGNIGAGGVLLPTVGSGVLPIPGLAPS